MIDINSQQYSTEMGANSQQVFVKSENADEAGTQLPAEPRGAAAVSQHIRLEINALVQFLEELQDAIVRQEIDFGDQQGAVHQ